MVALRKYDPRETLIPALTLSAVILAGMHREQLGWTVLRTLWYFDRGTDSVPDLGKSSFLAGHSDVLVDREPDSCQWRNLGRRYEEYDRATL